MAAAAQLGAAGIFAQPLLGPAGPSARLSSSITCPVVAHSRVSLSVKGRVVGLGTAGELPVYRGFRRAFGPDVNKHRSGRSSQGERNVKAQLIIQPAGKGGDDSGNGAAKVVIPAGFVDSLEKQLQQPTAEGLGVARQIFVEGGSVEAVSAGAKGAELVELSDGTVLGGTASDVTNGVASVQAEAAAPGALPPVGAAPGPQARKPQVSVVPGGRWNKFKTYSTIQRTFEIWSFVFVFAFKWWVNRQKWSYRGGVTEEKQTERRRVLAKWLKEGLLRLGPTFIKLGQQFSTRVDVLPKEYIDQLSELQDQVPPFESDVAVGIVERELGATVESVFERFDPVPIAAASLGQVHRARLQGKEVVVKVQRPGLKELFDIDLKNLRVIAINLQKWDPKSDGAKRDWVAIYDECANVLYQEIDYSKEGVNADLFRKNFKDVAWVKVPEIYWEYSTPQVLTMEYTPGIKINRTDLLDELSIDRKRIARLSVEAYLQQILKHGFFHADPHPGNIAVDNVGGGRLVFYDFGMMGTISPNIREGLVECFYGVYQKSADKVLDSLVQMGVLVPTGDMVAVRRTAQFFLNSFEERLKAQRLEREAALAEERKLGFKPAVSKEVRQAKKSQRLAAIGEDLLAISVDQPFRFPATFTFVVRAFSVLDGIGKGLDPRFDISEIAKPYAQELLNLRQAGADIFVRDLRQRWDRQAQAFVNAFQGPDRVASLERVVSRLEQGDLKLRVRSLESERAFKRVAQVQANIGKALLAATLLNVGTILYTSAMKMQGRLCLLASGVWAMQLAIGMLKVKKLDKTEAQITGQAA